MVRRRWLADDDTRREVGDDELLTRLAEWAARDLGANSADLLAPPAR